MNISEELLSAVFDTDTKLIEVTSEAVVYHQTNEIVNRYINLYELASLCKTWAYKLDQWSVVSGLSNGEYFAEVYNRHACSEDDSDFRESSNTEYDAVFQVGEWVLRQKGEINE